MPDTKGPKKSAKGSKKKGSAPAGGLIQQVNTAAAGVPGSAASAPKGSDLNLKNQGAVNRVQAHAGGNKKSAGGKGR